MLGKVGMSITLPIIEPTGTLIGASGGRILDTDGNVLVVPAGALSQTAPVQTKTVPPAILSGIVGPDFILLRAVELNVTSQVLSASAELSIPMPAGFNPALPIVVAKSIDVRGVQKLKQVALAQASGSLITSYVPPAFSASGAVKGIDSSGRYFFLQAKEPLGFVAGGVTGVSGSPASSAYVTSSTCSLVDLTNPAGAYLVAARVSPFDVTATDTAKNDNGTATGNIGSGNQVVNVNIAIKVTPPSVISLQPGDGAIKVDPNTPIVITFSEPVSRSTVTIDTIMLKDSSGATIYRPVLPERGQYGRDPLSLGSVQVRRRRIHSSFRRRSRTSRATAWSRT